MLYAASYSRQTFSQLPYVGYKTLFPLVAWKVSRLFLVGLDGYPFKGVPFGTIPQDFAVTAF